MDNDYQKLEAEFTRQGKTLVEWGEERDRLLAENANLRHCVDKLASNLIEAKQEASKNGSALAASQQNLGILQADHNAYQQKVTIAAELAFGPLTSDAEIAEVSLEGFPHAAINKLGKWATIGIAFGAFAGNFLKWCRYRRKWQIEVEDGEMIRLAELMDLALPPKETLSPRPNRKVKTKLQAPCPSQKSETK